MHGVLNRRALVGLVVAGTVTTLSGCAGNEATQGAARSVPPSPGDAGPGRQPQRFALTVFKDPSCGCCGGWIEHAKANGFSVKVHHPDALGDVFEEQEVPVELQACHLALNAQGAVFVGHIPAKFVRQYLEDPPAGTRGLTVPAMPVGTPGMEKNNEFEPYEVLSLGTDGSTKVFAKVRSAADQ